MTTPQLDNQENTMKFSICTALDNANRLAEVGYDYIELGVRRALIPEASDAEFQKILKEV